MSRQKTSTREFEIIAPGKDAITIRHVDVGNMFVDVAVAKSDALRTIDFIELRPTLINVNDRIVELDMPSPTHRDVVFNKFKTLLIEKHGSPTQEEQKPDI